MLFRSRRPRTNPLSSPQRLTKVDLHRYDEAWERDALEVLPEVYGSPRSLAETPLREITLKPQHRVIDLRKAADFGEWHLPESINLPLNSVGPHTPSPFSDPTVLEAQWVEEGMRCGLASKSSCPRTSTSTGHLGVPISRTSLSIEIVFGAAMVRPFS